MLFKKFLPTPSSQWDFSMLKRLIFLIGGNLLYNIVLVSALQHKSVIIICLSLPVESPSLPPSHPSRSSQSTKLGSLCYTATSHYLFYIWQCICQSQFLSLPHTHLSLLWPQVHSLLGSSVPFFWIPYIYPLIYDTYFPLSDLFHSVKEALSSFNLLQLIQICYFLWPSNILLHICTTSWRRKWQPTPVLLPWKSHGWRSLVQATIHGVAKSQARLSDFTSPHLLYPFICQQTPRLLPCPGYCKYFCNKLGIHVSFRIVVFSGYIPSSGIAGVYDRVIPSF